MKKKISSAILSLCALILLSCAGKNAPLVIIPETIDKPEINNLIGIDNIIETMKGPGNGNLPEWLVTLNNGGIDAIEKMDQYYGKYCFIGRNKNTNFEALTKWMENYQETRAFTRLAAVRIENRLNLNIALYPDDEYGAFYEKLVKKSYDAEYPDVVTEDTYWIKKTENSETNGFYETYEFFTFVSIDKTTMQDIIKKMITDTRAAVTPTRAQNNAINNIQLHFFEGF
jgi:hypothetical protein